jgi:cystathionine beta-lyase/cystathionine gamma-synthase
MTEHERGFATRAIHGAVTPPIEQAVPSAPIYQTSTYRFDTSEDYAETIAFRRAGYTYTRGYGNPTVEAFEAQIAALEGTEAAFGFASGMAAIHTVVTSLVAAGDRIVAGAQLYGGAYHLFTEVLPRFGVRADLVDLRDHAAVAAALPGAKLLYLETITNPAMSVADLPALGRLAAEAGVPAAVDNTFASPYLCNPAAFGFAYVIHSATKYLGGHHDLTGGVVCCSAEDRARLRTTVIDTGGTMAPFEAWLAMRGTMTLPLRMDRHAENALALARFLEAHPKVARVHYPGLPSHPDHEVARRVLRGAGGMLAVEVDGDVEAGMRACDALELAWVATSLGGTHTLVGHAASTTHRQMDPAARRAAGIADGLIRVSVGLEDVEDLIEDFGRALEKA